MLFTDQISKHRHGHDFEFPLFKRVDLVMSLRKLYSIQESWHHNNCSYDGSRAEKVEAECSP